MAVSSTSFKNGHTKGTRPRRRRIAYDAIFLKALEEDGDVFVQKIREHRDSSDRALSLKACDIFFKYARPPETDDLLTPPDTSFFKDAGLTLEEGLQLRERLKENQSRFVESCVQEIIQNRDQAHV